MRKVFIETDNIEVAEQECPWACEIVEVIEGYMCFESWDDFEIWNNQK